MIKRNLQGLLFNAAAYFLLALIAIDDANAVPSFARQMNMECGGCHTRFPKLNAFGRQFKLSGYTLATGGQLESSGPDKKTLGLNDLPPFSVMFQTAYTNVGGTVPDTQNNAMQFPQQLSMFVAGRITPRIGSFVQLTYSQVDDKFGMDNAEFRYANTTSIGGKPVSYGITLNNNPTVEDLWNSTSAWGFPFAGPDTAPGPSAGALIDGGLGQDVAGLGGYALLNQMFYVAATFYRSAHLGSDAPSIDSAMTLDSMAPYLRFAWQHQWASNYLEIGAYGMWADVFPAGVIGATDKYKDIAADFQYERMLSGGQLTVHGTFIHEKRNLDATIAENSSNKLNTLRLDGSYGFDAWELAAGVFNTTGDSDNVLYAPAEVDGSAYFKPDSRGWIAQVAYFPWQNVQMTLQYTGYNKFNGGSTNYDGFGRNASDNNSLFLQAWFVW
jgi:hypothetical protein